MEEVITKAIGVLLELAVTALAVYGLAYLKARFGTETLQRVNEELQLKQDLVAVIVKYVEQAFYDLEGPQKLDLATNLVAEQLGKLGLTIDGDEIKTLIEAAIREFKDVFGEEWGRHLGE